jgi:hypothetical protein
MKKLLFLALLTLLCLGVGLFVSCGGNNNSGDDTSDDDAAVDDDTVDDDTADDDTADDDTADSTWNDSSSGLTWQVTQSSDYMTWDEAKTYCENLSLAGGGWHLPTISELRTLIRGCEGTVSGGSCEVTDDCTSFIDCWSDSCICDVSSGPNNGCYGPAELPGECDWYWSSSPVAGNEDAAWFVYFCGGLIYDNNIYYDALYVRCVR